MPGDPSEIKDFQEKTSVSSKLHLELNFPEIDVNFQDPPFFELIYNRWVRTFSHALSYALPIISAFFYFLKVWK